MKIAIALMTLIFATTVFAHEHEAAATTNGDETQMENPAAPTEQPVKKEHKKKKKAKAKKH